MKKQPGFTLIELLVVISIISLLSTIALAALNSARQKSRDAKRVADARTIRTALEMYYSEQNKYPATAAGGITLGDITAAEVLSDNGFTAKALAGSRVFMAKVPSNPAPEDDGPNCDKFGYRYYNSLAPNTTYRLVYCLANSSGGASLGYNTACESGISGCAKP